MAAADDVDLLTSEIAQEAMAKFTIEKVCPAQHPARIRDIFC